MDECWSHHSARDATRRMSATALVCAAPAQQQFRRSSNSVAAALQPSTQNSKGRLIIFDSARRVPPQGAASCSSSAAAAAAQLRRSSSSRRRSGPATMTDERPVAFEAENYRKRYPPTDRDRPPGPVGCHRELLFRKSLGHCPRGGSKKLRILFGRLKRAVGV